MAAPEKKEQEPMTDHLCPYITMIGAAEKVVEELGDIHKNPESARGGLAAYRKASEAMRDAYPCEGPVRTSSNMVDCPLADLMVAAQRFALGPVPEMAIDPERMVDADLGSAGQYL